jgi:hypothetical protein
MQRRIPIRILNPHIDPSILQINHPNRFPQPLRSLSVSAGDYPLAAPGRQTAYAADSAIDAATKPCPTCAHNGYSSPQPDSCSQSGPPSAAGKRYAAAYCPAPSSQQLSFHRVYGPPTHEVDPDHVSRPQNGAHARQKQAFRGTGSISDVPVAPPDTFEHRGCVARSAQIANDAGGRATVGAAWGR